MSDHLRQEAESLNIMTLKLNNGDEVIGLVNRNNPKESVLLLEQPLAMIKVYNGHSNSYTLNFEEWMPTSEDNLVAVIRSNIVGYSKANLDAKEHYLNTIINLAQPPEAIADEEDDYYDDVPLSEATLH